MTSPVRQGWEWFSCRTGAKGEKQATTLLLLSKTTSVYGRRKKKMEGVHPSVLPDLTEHVQKLRLTVFRVSLKLRVPPVA